MERRGFLKNIAALAGVVAIPGVLITHTQAGTQLSPSDPTEMEDDLTPILQDEDLLPVNPKAIICSLLPHSNTFYGTAGEDIPSGYACTVGKDGLVHPAKYNVVDKEDEHVFGISATTVYKGRNMTLFADERFSYHDDVKPGVQYYLSTTPGRLTENRKPNQKRLAIGLDQSRIQFIKQ